MTDFRYEARVLKSHGTWQIVLQGVPRWLHEELQKAINTDEGVVVTAGAPYGMNYTDETPVSLMLEIRRKTYQWDTPVAKRKKRREGGLSGR